MEDDLLVATSSEGLSFIDFVDPADPSPASVSFPGVSFWYRTDILDIHEREQAHLPQGFYGVETLDFGGIFTNSAPGLPPPVPRRIHAPEWQVVPFSMLIATSSSGSNLLDSLDPDANWAFDDVVAPIEYEDWTRRALGLSPAEQVPPFFEDSDFDGRSNGWEYFTGSDPGNPREAIPLRVSIDTTEQGDRFLTGYLPLNPHATPFLLAVPSVSFDLQSWDDTPGTFETRVERFLTGTAIRLNDPVEVHEAVFMRVELTTVTE